MITLDWVPKFYWAGPYQTDRECNLTKKHHSKIKKLTKNLDLQSWQFSINWKTDKYKAQGKKTENFDLKLQALFNFCSKSKNT